MRVVRKEMVEQEILTLTCDLCGSPENIARYDCNRRCQNCRREVCNRCLNLGNEFSNQCLMCSETGMDFLPKINAAYKLYKDLCEQWKAASLARRAPGVGGGK